MGPFYLAFCCVGDPSQGILMKLFNGRSKSLFSAISTAFAGLTVLFLSGFNLNFNSQIIFHAIFFGVMMATCTFTFCKALGRGSLSFSALIVALSLIVPAFYGIILGDNPSNIFYIGLAVLVVAIVLINLDFDKSENKQKSKLDWLWVIFISLAFLGNGVACCINTDFSKTFNGEYTYEMLLIAFTVSAFLQFIPAIFTDRKSFKEDRKQLSILTPLWGLCNGATNSCVILAIAEGIKASVLFPVVSGVSMTISFAVSALVFKEKFKPLKFVGFFLGIVSVVLLNL